MSERARNLLARSSAVDAERWSDGRQDDPQAAIPLRGHPDLRLESHRALVERLRHAPDAPTHVAESPGRGLGLFALDEIRASARIGEYVGERVEPREPLSHYLMTYHPTDASFPLALDAARAGNHTRYINHADTPNTAPWWLFWGAEWHVVIVALRAIRPNEELFVDYGPGFLERRGVDVANV